MAEPIAPILVSEDLTRHYEVPRGFLKGAAVLRALDGVSFEVAPGRTLAVVGESGCGKSTLARQLVMIEKPTAGRLVIDGADVAGADAATLRRLRRRVQMVFQNPYASLNPRKTVAQTLEEPLAINTDLDRAARRERVAAMMARVGLRPEQAGRYPHMFSGGQRQRVAIARALMLDPAVVVADEPVSALDVTIQAQILALLANLTKEYGLTMLFISHDLAVIRQIADRTAVMYHGKLVEEGSTAQVFETPQQEYTRSLLAAIPGANAT